MANYPITRNEKSNDCSSHSSTYSDEYAKNCCSLYLSDEFEYGDFRNTTHYYRLHAREPHAQRDYLKYNISCPKCHHLLRVVDGPVNYHVLGLYECPNCNNH